MSESELFRVASGIENQKGKQNNTAAPQLSLTKSTSPDFTPGTQTTNLPNNPKSNSTTPSHTTTINPISISPSCTNSINSGDKNVMKGVGSYGGGIDGGSRSGSHANSVVTVKVSGIPNPFIVSAGVLPLKCPHTTPGGSNEEDKTKSRSGKRKEKPESERSRVEIGRGQEAEALAGGGQGGEGSGCRGDGDGASNLKSSRGNSNTVSNKSKNCGWSSSSCSDGGGSAGDERDTDNGISADWEENDSENSHQHHSSTTIATSKISASRENSGDGVVEGGGGGGVAGRGHSGGHSKQNTHHKQGLSPTTATSSNGSPVGILPSLPSSTSESLSNYTDLDFTAGDKGKRRTDRYDSSESSDSGVATLSPSTSDSPELTSPYSPSDSSSEPSDASSCLSSGRRCGFPTAPFVSSTSSSSSSSSSTDTDTDSESAAASSSPTQRRMTALSAVLESSPPPQSQTTGGGVTTTPGVGLAAAVTGSTGGGVNFSGGVTKVPVTNFISFQIPKSQTVHSGFQNPVKIVEPGAVGGKSVTPSSPFNCDVRNFSKTNKSITNIFAALTYPGGGGSSGANGKSAQSVIPDLRQKEYQPIVKVPNLRGTKSFILHGEGQHNKVIILSVPKTSLSIGKSSAAPTAKTHNNINNNNSSNNNNLNSNNNNATTNNPNDKLHSSKNNNNSYNNNNSTSNNNNNIKHNNNSSDSPNINNNSSKMTNNNLKVSNKANGTIGSPSSNNSHASAMSNAIKSVLMEESLSASPARKKARLESSDIIPVQISLATSELLESKPQALSIPIHKSICSTPSLVQTGPKKTDHSLVEVNAKTKMTKNLDVSKNIHNSNTSTNTKHNNNYHHHPHHHHHHFANKKQLSHQPPQTTSQPHATPPSRSSSATKTNTKINNSSNNTSSANAPLVTFNYTSDRQPSHSKKTNAASPAPEFKAKDISGKSSTLPTLKSPKDSSIAEVISAVARNSQIRKRKGEDITASTTNKTSLCCVTPNITVCSSDDKFLTPSLDKTTFGGVALAVLSTPIATINSNPPSSGSSISISNNSTSSKSANGEAVSVNSCCLSSSSTSSYTSSSSSSSSISALASIKSSSSPSSSSATAAVALFSTSSNVHSLTTTSTPEKHCQQQLAKTSSIAKSSSSAPPDNLCMWKDCSCADDANLNILEHIQTTHVSPQLKCDGYVCLWEGCKVFSKKSSSLSWLERHVLSHSGNKPFKCIFPGCGLSFSSQGTLERHVNSHISTNGSANGANGNSSLTNRKIDSSPVKSVRRKKKVFRKQRLNTGQFVDYFDKRTMEVIKHKLASAVAFETMSPHDCTFRSEVLARRTCSNEEPHLLVHWYPEFIFPDEWIPQSKFQRMKAVPLRRIPSDKIKLLYPHMFPPDRTVKAQRKWKPSSSSSSSLSMSSTSSLASSSNASSPLTVSLCSSKGESSSSSSSTSSLLSLASSNSSSYFSTRRAAVEDEQQLEDDEDDSSECCSSSCGCPNVTADGRKPINDWASLFLEEELRS